MSSEAFGNLAVVVTGDASQFDKTMEHATSRVKQFGKDAHSHMSGKEHGGGLFGGDKTIGGFLESAKDKLMGVSTGTAAITGVAFGAVEGMKKLGESAIEVGEKWHELELRAAKFGTTAEKMKGLEIASKGHAEDLGTGLRHMQKLVGEAAQGGKEAQATLSAFGLDWKKLESMDVADQMKMVADALKSMPSNAQKVAGEMKIFGKSGTELDRLVRGGSKGIEQGEETARKKGLNPNEDFMKDYDKYLAAKRSWEQSKEGFKNTVATTIGRPAMNLATHVTNGLADTLDAWFGPDSKNQYGVYAGSSRGTDEAKEKEREAKKRREAQTQEKNAKALAETNRHIAGATAVGNLTEMAEQLDKQLAVVGKSEQEVKAWEQAAIAAKNGAVGWAEALKRVEVATKAVADKKEALKLEDDAKSGAEGLSNKANHLKELFDKGLISEKAFGKGMAGILADAEKMGGKMDQIQNPMPFAKGSQEDRTFGITSRQAQDAANQDPVDRLQQAFGRMLTQEQEQTGVQRQLLEAVRGGGIKFVGVEF